MKTITIFLHIIFLIFSVNVGAQTRIIAHRGYWDVDGHVENSLSSLEAAGRIGVYGSEFDVHITRDGKAVVYHDDDIPIESHHRTVNIESADYSIIKKTRLANGERIPTLSRYLAKGRKLPCRLILEIKEHHSPEAEERCVREVLRLVKAAKMEDRVDYISFSKFVCQRLHTLMPQASVSYLNGDLTPREIKDMGLSGIDYHSDILLSHPEWISQSHQLGLSVNVWTVNDTEDIRRFVSLGVDFITTNRPVEAMRIAHP
ncbi:MAG: glycerophosphodiester phosphodiesterase [Prevotella sp.]|nr:glycerophosphodiester phosphodiesterase [Prevotella sp.]